MLSLVLNLQKEVDIVDEKVVVFRRQFLDPSGQLSITQKTCLSIKISNTTRGIYTQRGLLYNWLQGRK